MGSRRDQEGPSQQRESILGGRSIGVTFADQKTDNAFEKLKTGKHHERQLYNFIHRAINDLKHDPYCGVKIPRAYWPKFYHQYNIKNLWKYDLPNGWRLIYHVKEETVTILCFILEWFDHKRYTRRFGYEPV